MTHTASSCHATRICTSKQFYFKRFSEISLSNVPQLLKFVFSSSAKTFICFVENSFAVTLRNRVDILKSFHKVLIISGVQKTFFPSSCVFSQHQYFHNLPYMCINQTLLPCSLILFQSVHLYLQTRQYWNDLASFNSHHLDTFMNFKSRYLDLSTRLQHTVQRYRFWKHQSYNSNFHNPIPTCLLFFCQNCTELLWPWPYWNAIAQSTPLKQKYPWLFKLPRLKLLHLIFFWILHCLSKYRHQSLIVAWFLEPRFSRM